MSGPFVQVLLILLLIVINGVFAMSEIVMISAKKARLKQHAENDDKRVEQVLELQENPNGFLSTVQIGISLVGIMSGALGSATLAAPIASLLIRLGIDQATSEKISFVLVVLLITYLSLVIGELIPKRLGLNNPEKIALSIARSMAFLSKLAAPIVAFLGWSTEVGLKLMGVKISDEPAVSQEEIQYMLEEGAVVGVFEEAEPGMIERVFRLGDRRVDMIVTPRTELVWLDVNDPIERHIETVSSHPFSRLPVGDGSLDAVIGVVRSKDILSTRLFNEDVDLHDLLFEPAYIPESMPALRALELIKENNTNMAMVIDEYGGLLGIITLFDILESLVGDISVDGIDGYDSIIQRDDGSYLVDGLLPVDELRQLLGVDQLAGESLYGYQTLGGFIMAHFGQIPSAGNYFDSGNFRFEVVDMDDLRVDKVLISILKDENEKDTHK
ncbi:MAG: HlyC/CorC family transporter [Anaerolineaceae bacterium]|nr:HlyC/CorC family transporter [Anaerolineaceae bacterium]